MRSFAPFIDRYLMGFAAKRRPGIKLKFFRASLGMSQRQFAELFNLTRSTISSIERGDSQPSMRMLMRLHNFMMLSTDSILYDGEPQDVRVIRGYETLTAPRRR